MVLKSSMLKRTGLKRLRTFLSGIPFFVLLACGPIPVKTDMALQIEGLVIENQSTMFVTAVRLLVPATGNFVSCGNIPPGLSCSTTFPERNYVGNAVEITWSQAGQIHSTGPFDVATPDDIETDKPALVRVVITGPGPAGAMVIQR